MAQKTSIVTESGKVRRVIVVGGGLAGLDDGHQALRGRRPRRPVLARAGEALAHGLRAGRHQRQREHARARATRPQVHFDETVYGGDFLANQPPVKEMADAAPGIIDLLDRMGVPFNRTPEGLRDFRRFGGTLFKRTAFAGATTGQQLLYALDEQVRRWETIDVEDEHGVVIPGEKMVRKYEFWDFLGPSSTTTALRAASSRRT